MNRPPVPGQRPSQPDLQKIFDQAMSAHRAGQLDVAATLYRQVLSFSKKQFAPLHMLGVIEGQRGNLAEGVRQITKAIKINPNSSDAYLNIGRMQAELGELENAERSLRKAVFLNPENALAHANLSAALDRLERYDDALKSADLALALAPNDPLALFNRANALFYLNRCDEAKKGFQQLLILDPQNADAWLAIGNTHAQLKELSEALKALNKAASITPSLPKLWLSLGGLFRQLGRDQDALAAYDRELFHQPDLAAAWLGRGQTLTGLKRHEEAVQAFEKALRLEPNLTRAATARFFANLSLCDWKTFEADLAEIVKQARHPRATLAQLDVMRLPLSPEQILTITRRLAAQAFSGIKPGALTVPSSVPDRIKIAYVSPDLRDHPVSQLMAGVFEHHDRSKFEITALSLTNRPNDVLRPRLVKAFDRFIDAEELDDTKAAQALRELDIHIAVDLSGFTLGNRMPLFAGRIAPIQVNYLGFPGTSGTDFLDYMIADRTVIPVAEEKFYSEKIVCLPDSFMPADSLREIGAGPITRREAGLPDDGFVFCDFNDSMKIEPRIFDVWMSLLRHVDGAVLWLRAYNPTAIENLKLEAKRRGVDPNRLVFAPSRPLVADHLARHRLADLFLDTLPYNAHATTSDALWSGVPVVTCIGETFAGRVAASQLKAAGLPDLVTHTLADYEALALKIARETALLASLRVRLADNRLTAALFDTARFTRHLEMAYTTMLNHARGGQPPAAFTVEALPH